MGMNGRTGPKRSAAQRDLDQERIATWTAEGRSLRWMARELGLTHAQVHADRLKLRRAALGRAGLVMSAELERLLLANDRATAMAVDSFAASKQAAETTVSEQKTDPEGGVTTTTRVTCHSGPGDAAFLLAFIKAQTERRLLLGLTPPAKQELAGPGGAALFPPKERLAPADVVARYRVLIAAAEAVPEALPDGHHDGAAAEP